MPIDAWFPHRLAKCRAKKEFTRECKLERGKVVVDGCYETESGRYLQHNTQYIVIVENETIIERYFFSKRCREIK